MNFFKKSLFLVAIFSFVFLSSSAVIFSDNDVGDQSVIQLNVGSSEFNNQGGSSEFTTPTSATNSSGTSTKINNPLGQKITDIPTFILKILEGAIKIGMSVAVLAIVYCGFLFVTAKGNTEDLTKAKNALLYTVIGAAVLLGSLAIAQMIKDTIVEFGLINITYFIS
jgi:hypothetical protein